MAPEISEFSYGYALTSEIVRTFGASMMGAPVFPSLRDEGSLGYDLELPIASGPVFLQFKLSDYMVRSTALGSAVVSVPHYRMHLRPRKYSKQHDLLLALDVSGRKVFYVAPEFHRASELDSAYLGNKVVARSAFFRPGNIGRLPDDEEHFVCFAAGSSHGYRFSEPQKVVRLPHSEAIKAFTAEDVEPEGRNIPASRYLRQIADELIATWAKLGENAEQRRLGSMAELRAKNGPLEYLGWVAQTLFACAVFIRLQPRDAEPVSAMAHLVDSPGT